jgi:glyoxylase-like metal-dependent hydrolase (beta-lactamase superfamily II)
LGPIINNPRKEEGMRQRKKFVVIVAAAAVLALNHMPSIFAQQQKGGAEDKKKDASKGFYILEGRDDVGREVHEQFTIDIKTVPVAEGLYMLMAAGGNLNLGVCIGDDGVLLIDDLFPEFTDAVMGEIRKLTDKPIRFVVNTHWHWDHTGGNENMAKAGAIIIAQESVMQWMTTWQISGMSGTPKAPQPPEGLPVITFKDKTTLRFNGHTIDVINVGPAHTAGDVVAHFVEKDVYFMGDIYLAASYPSLDLNTGGDIQGLIAALDKVLANVKPDTVIMPGHGGRSNSAELKEYRDMVVTLRDRVQAAIDGGKTIDEIIATKPTADLDEKWANPIMSPDVVLKFIHASLTGAAGG